MAGLNKVMLIGHLGADPELRYTPGGQPVANIRMATSESWNDREGNRQEKTEWHKIVVFGKLAELCNNYLRRGRQAYFEGRLQTRQWDDRDGNKRYTTEIVAREVVFLGSKNDAPNESYGQSDSGYGGGGGGGGGENKRDEQKAPPTSNVPDYAIPEDDEYPF